MQQNPLLYIPMIRARFFKRNFSLSSIQLNDWLALLLKGQLESCILSLILRWNFLHRIGPNQHFVCYEKQTFRLNWINFFSFGICLGLSKLTSYSILLVGLFVRSWQINYQIFQPRAISLLTLLTPDDIHSSSPLWLGWI